MKCQPFLHAEMGGWIVELNRDMSYRMSGVKNRKILLNIIETFSNDLVEVSVRYRYRERAFEFSPLIDELYRLCVGKACVVSLQLPTPNHPAAIRQFDPNQIRLNRHCLFRNW